MDRFLCMAIVSLALVACSSSNEEPEAGTNNPVMPVETSACSGLDLGFVNLDAESVDPATAEDQFGALTSWETITGNTSSTLYGQGGYPEAANSAQGSRLFTGGNEETSVSQQTVALTPNVIGCRFIFSAEIGGFASQEDNASVSISFIGSADDVLTTFTLGPVSAEDRNGESVLLPLETNGTIPDNATQARITITQNRLSGNANDGYADNVAVTLN